MEDNSDYESDDEDIAFMAQPMGYQYEPEDEELVQRDRERAHRERRAREEYVPHLQLD